MSLETHSFEFGEFLLDAREKVLLRDGKPLSITPKAFQLLLALVENHGHLVEKDVLMKKVWTDSFVEESNLTYTMRLVRVILGDNKKNPRFIETVPRRGYRFIAEVSRNFNENSAAQTVSQASEKSAAGLSSIKKFLLPGAFLIVLIIVAGFWYARSKTAEAAAPVLSAPFALEKLSTNGKVLDAVISPDGKNVFYTSKISGKMSVWLRQLETASNVELIPPSDDIYTGLALSPDGNSLYFARRPKSVKGQTDIYRISILGGVPQKIIGETQGWISLAPDGAKISFVRCYYREEENCSLWIADAADGRNERKLVSRPRPVRIADNEISPDGKTIVFAVGQSENQANEFGLTEVNIESGTEREITGEKFFNIKNLAWLPDKSGLLVTASRIPNKNFRIWQISAVSGEVVPLTKDSETYSALSLDKEAGALVSTQVKRDFRLQLFSMESLSERRVLADAASVAFAPNGKIFFSSSMSGNDEIWSVNPDGNNQHQLTNDAADEAAPVVSAANDFVFFMSNRTGEAHVWRMNADGSNQTQITHKTGGFPLFASPDGGWLYYHHGLNRTLWRVSTALPGDEQMVLNKRKYYFAFSPDGSQVAFSEKQGEENILMIVSLADGQPVKTFKYAAGRARLAGLGWSPDGENLVYILADGELENNILWFQPLGKELPRQIGNLGDEEIMSLTLAPNGKAVAVVQGGWRHDAVLLKGLR